MTQQQAWAETRKQLAFLWMGWLERPGYGPSPVPVTIVPADRWFAWRFCRGIWMNETEETVAQALRVPERTHPGGSFVMAPALPEQGHTDPLSAITAWSHVLSTAADGAYASEIRLVGVQQAIQQDWELAQVLGLIFHDRKCVCLLPYRVAQVWEQITYSDLQQWSYSPDILCTICVIPGELRVPLTGPDGHAILMAATRRWSPTGGSISAGVAADRSVAGAVRAVIAARAMTGPTMR